MMDGYKELKTLGKGSFGEVRLAESLSTGEKVALKFVRILSGREGGGVPKAVFREIESLRQLQDKHRIVNLIEAFPHDSELVLVLEYLPSDLSKLLTSATESLPRSHIKVKTGLSVCYL